jgi:hypothetical protein
MKSRRAWWWFAAALLFTASAPAAVTNRVPVITVSTSREFVVHAPNALMSSALCAYVERIKQEWLRRLALEDMWRDVIVLVVRDRADNLPNAPILTAEMFQAESRLEYRLTLVVPPAPDDATFTAAIVELLCAEAANRDQPRPRDAPYVGAPIPAWLAEGLAQSIVGQTDQLLAVVRRSAGGSRPQTAMELMRATQRSGDTADRVLHRANAWLLVEGLLRLPNGPRKLQQLLTELGATRIFAQAFEEVYDNDFPDTAVLEQWWNEQQTRAQELTVAGNLTETETTRQLDRLLAVETEPRPVFDELWRYSDQPWLKPWLRDRSAGLEVLKACGHSLYRPAVAKYAEAVTQLLAGNLNRFRRAVGDAVRLRRAADQQAQQIRDILDRAERTYCPVRTNAYQDFFRTLDQLEKFEQQRRGPIGDYLDRFDQ